MIPEVLIEIEQALRAAVARRQYEQARRLIDDLAGLADSAIDGMVAGDPLRRRVTEWVLQTMSWTRTMVAAQRQTCRSELDRLPNLGRYLVRDPASPAVSFDL